eukprot:CAMPEP_0197859428 /NCGR_PEP_ID=MMETSP1438-20131217/33968_1 /TAXON_ID=1461541 /ORGANISM="Pterosperma sp., Strain CCMP1384" /LENGTH=149 /DNA_ID=CAMNT_0043475907 /DNA_START=411 /DNA_END=857 /DNA_ORIENTATION=+
MADSSFSFTKSSKTTKADALEEIKNEVVSRTRDGNVLSLNRCQKLMARLIDTINKQGDEDFQLLSALHQQVKKAGLDDAVIATMGEDTTANQIAAVLKQSQQHLASRAASDCTKEKMLELRYQITQRMVDLIDMAILCREERIKLLAAC